MALFDKNWKEENNLDVKHANAIYLQLCKYEPTKEVKVEKSVDDYWGPIAAMGDTMGDCKDEMTEVKNVNKNKE